METWKPVLGFENHYEVSDLGRCRRLTRGKKLTAEKVENIRKMLSDGYALIPTGKANGVSHVTVAMIRDGKTWNGNPNYRYLKPHERNDFYFNFCFCVCGKYRLYSAHRAVWEAFNGKIPNGLEINHKNLNRSDNRLVNLEILTRTQNIKHAIDFYTQQNGTHNSGGFYHERKKALKEKRMLKKIKAEALTTR